MLQCPGLVEARRGAVAALSCWRWAKVNIGCLTPVPSKPGARAGLGAPAAHALGSSESRTAAAWHGDQVQRRVPAQEPPETPPVAAV